MVNIAHPGCFSGVRPRVLPTLKLKPEHKSKIPLATVKSHAINVGSRINVTPAYNFGFTFGETIWD